MDADDPAPRLEIDYVLDLQHRPNQTDECWALANYELLARVHDTRCLHRVVLLRRADLSLWAATFEASTVDNTDDFVEFTAARMSPCVAIAYVGVDDKDEAMTVLGIKAPERVHDNTIKPEDPAAALERLDAQATAHDYPQMILDVSTVAAAVRYLIQRNIELQGVPEQPEPAA